MIDLTGFAGTSIDPDRLFWLILNKDDMPLVVLDAAPTPVLTVWASRDLAAGFQRQHHASRGCRLVPWELKRIVAWCRSRSVHFLMPNQPSPRRGSEDALIDLASIARVLVQQAADN